MDTAHNGGGPKTPMCDRRGPKDPGVAASLAATGCRGNHLLNASCVALLDWPVEDTVRYSCLTMPLLYVLATRNIYRVLDICNDGITHAIGVMIVLGYARQCADTARIPLSLSVVLEGPAPTQFGTRDSIQRAYETLVHEEMLPQGFEPQFRYLCAAARPASLRVERKWARATPMQVGMLAWQRTREQEEAANTQKSVRASDAVRGGAGT